MIMIASKKAGKTKSAYIVEAIDEKLGLAKNREKTIRQLAGWLTHGEAAELRTSLDVFTYRCRKKGLKYRSMMSG
jgi:hypothetical protein